MEIKGKTVVVIGATGGIGRVFSLGLGLKGANLIMVGRDQKILNSLKAKLAQKKVRSFVFACDVTKSSEVGKLYKKLKKFKKVDIVIHAAGLGIYKKIEDISLDEWNASINVNVNSVFLITQKLLPLLKNSEKSYFLVTGSGMGKVAVAGRSAYCTSKFALRGLILTLAKEFKNTNVNFIHLTLGSVLTSFGPLTLEEKEEKAKGGKGYIIPTELVHTVLTKIENDTLESETPIYPKGYYKSSNKGIT